jgi:hypothetical protein
MIAFSNTRFNKVTMMIKGGNALVAKSTMMTPQRWGKLAHLTLFAARSSKEGYWFFEGLREGRKGGIIIGPTRHHFGSCCCHRKLIIVSLFLFIPE